MSPRRPTGDGRMRACGLRCGDAIRAVGCDVRAIPIPDGVAEASGGRRVIIGEPGDPTRDDVRPCEYVLTESALYPGRPCLTALLVLDDDDRAAIADGAKLSLTLDGGELPWSIAVERGL